MILATVGGSALVFTGGLLAWHSSGYELPEETQRLLRTLTAKEALIVAAVAARILRSDHRDDPSAADVDAALFIDGIAARLAERNLRDLRRLLHVVEHVLPVWEGHFSRFTRLAGAEQDAVLRAMMTSEVTVLRGAFDSLKCLCVMAYYRDPRTWARIGYDGPLVARPPRGWAAT
jgi:hypothetical protein